jgi:hypothetical protein
MQQRGVKFTGRPDNDRAPKYNPRVAILRRETAPRGVIGAERPKENVVPKRVEQPIDTRMTVHDEDLDEKKGRIVNLTNHVVERLMNDENTTLDLALRVCDIAYRGRYYVVITRVSLTNVSFIEAGPVILINIGLDCDVNRLWILLSAIAAAYDKGVVSKFAYDGPPERAARAFELYRYACEWIGFGAEMSFVRR